MKIIIEPADTKEIQEVAKRYYNLNLTVDQATELINESSMLQRELIGGGLDTPGRECLIDVIIEKIMKGKPKVKDDMFPGHDWWHWPANGSSQKYTTFFAEKFHKAAIKAGYRVEE